MKTFKSILVVLIVGMAMGSAITLYVAMKYGLFSECSENQLGSISENTGSANTANKQLSSLDLDLTPAYVEDEMSRTGSVVRAKKVGLNPIDQRREDEEIKADIKRIITHDPVLANSQLTVLVRKGKVTFVGPKLPPGHIGRAIVLAYNVEDVTSVTSTLKIIPRTKE